MSRRASLAALLATLVVLAGCAAPVLPSDDASPSPATETGSATSAAGGTEPTASPAENPWEEETLTVALVDETGSTRAYAPLVERALRYWEGNATRYAGYGMAFELDPDAEDPDVVVRVVEDIEQCGTEGHTAGCAPYVTAGPVPRPADVRVVAGLSDDSTVRVLEHEFGHLLGLNHGDAPRAVMAARSVLTTLPRTNATDRAVPWSSPTLSVYVDDASVPARDRSTVDDQVRHALGYVDRGADGTVPENVSFVRAANRSQADLVVRFSDDLECGTEATSCFRVLGLDPDGDGALETYTRAVVTIDADLDRDAVGWHVGRWTARALGVTDDELPEPLRPSATYTERRSEWWR